MHRTRTSQTRRSLPVLAFGCDYNPEQWPRHIWEQDVQLMQQAGINLVTIGVFSWAMIEPREGERDFTWLDEIIDLLWQAGISVDLATPIASPPPWVGSTYPQTLAVWPNGQRSTWGSRNHFSVASAKYRELCASITTDLVHRYANHPAVVMWHVGNEFGQLCYGPESAQRFREWLAKRYGGLDALNEAWGTAFWSQRYGDFSEVMPPRDTTYLINPAQDLDFKRFSSQAMLELYLEQVDIIRAADPDAIVTTNFMGFFPLVDYHSWAPHVDIVADDIYPDPEAHDAPQVTALTHELMRSLGGGRPWMIMEQAITSVNWRAHNVPKPPARTRLESLSAVARGARGICFFQWRASTAGSERFHSALLPHAGPESQVHHAVRTLGAELGDLAQRYRATPLGVRSAFSGAGPAPENSAPANPAHGDVNVASANSQVEPDHEPHGSSIAAQRVALIFDWPSWWATGQQALPTSELDALKQLKAWHRALWLRGIRSDVIAPQADLGGYDLVLVPSLHLLDEVAAGRMLDYAEAGGTLVCGPFTAVADLTNRVYHAPFPAPLRAGVGVAGQEWIPLPQHDAPLRLITDAFADHPLPGDDYAAQVFVEKLDLDPDTTALLRYAQLDPDPYGLTGRAAVTRREHGRGSVRYVAALLNEVALGDVLEHALRESGIEPLAPNERNPHLDIVPDHLGVYLLNYGHSPVQITRAALEEYLGAHLALPTDHTIVTVPPLDAQIIDYADPHTPTLP